MTGYEKLKKIAEDLKNRRLVQKQPAPDYKNMTTEKLEELKTKAEAWMAANTEHPRFDEANDRYMAIHDELTFRYADELLLMKEIDERKG